METVAPVIAAPVSGVNASQVDTVQGHGVIVAVEHKLVEYIARLQFQGSFGQDFLNPTALGSEALKMLKGYMARASHLEQVTAREGPTMDDVAGQALTTTDVGTKTALAPGPAQSQMQPRGPAETVEGLEAVEAVGPADLDRAIQMLSQLLSFTLESSFIGTATTNVSKSVNTLMHGQ